MRKSTKALVLGLCIGLCLACVMSGAIYYYFGIFGLKQQALHYELLFEDYKENEFITAFRLSETVNKDHVFVKDSIEMIEIPKYLYNENLIVTESEILARQASRVIQRGQLIGRDMIYLKDRLPDDLRVMELSQIVLPILLKAGDYVDIRISFPSGLDYVVLSKKHIENLIRSESEGVNKGLQVMTLYLSSEEMIRLSSAFVDAYLSQDTYLYASVYVDADLQNEAQVTYPVNEDVQRLLITDPNVLNTALLSLDIIRRQQLHESLMKISTHSRRSDAIPVAAHSEWSVEYSPREKGEPTLSLSDLD